LQRALAVAARLSSKKGESGTRLEKYINQRGEVKMNARNRLAGKLLVPMMLFVASPAAMSMDMFTMYFWEEVACPNEVVYLEGSARVQVQGTGKGWVYQVFWTGDGWGLDSGDEYLIQGKWMEVVNEQRPYVFYWNDHFEMVGKGQAPTYRLYSKIRFDEADGDGYPVPDSIQFEDGDWACPAVAFEVCVTEPCSAY
jgi:hypothetical protein